MGRPLSPVVVGNTGLRSWLTPRRPAPCDAPQASRRAAGACGQRGVSEHHGEGPPLPQYRLFGSTSVEALAVLSLLARSALWRCSSTLSVPQSVLQRLCPAAAQTCAALPLQCPCSDVPLAAASSCSRAVMYSPCILAPPPPRPHLLLDSNKHNVPWPSMHTHSTPTGTGRPPQHARRRCLRQPPTHLRKAM